MNNVYIVMSTTAEKLIETVEEDCYVLGLQLLLLRRILCESVVQVECLAFLEGFQDVDPARAFQ
jgi:hypothetical protein